MFLRHKLRRTDGKEHRYRSMPAGDIGVLRDRPDVVVSAHGGYCGAVPPAQPDFLTPYLRAIFATIGIFQVDFVHFERLARGPDAVARALAQASDWMTGRLPHWLDAAS